MADGKRCPACGHDIGIWAVVSAMWPTRVWCPHCGARLRYRDHERVSLIVVFATILIGLVSSGLGLLAVFRDWHVVWCAAVGLFTFGVLVALLEWLGSRFLRANRTLECLKRPSQDSSDYREAPPADDDSTMR